jgi:hypothetical protein
MQHYTKLIRKANKLFLGITSVLLLYTKQIGENIHNTKQMPSPLQVSQQANFMINPIFECTAKVISTNVTIK